VALRPAPAPKELAVRLTFSLSLGLAVVLFAGAMPAAEAQDGPLRERIRARMQDKQAPAASSPGAESAGAPRGTHEHTIEHGGLKRRYLVHVPPGYTPGTPLPLVLAFHGGGGDMHFMAREDNYGLIGKANSAGFVVVFPSGYSKFPGGKLATWNAGACCGDARDRQVDDVGFVRAVVAAVRQQLSIDPARLYATGMSNGGMMAHRLACEAADLFAAIAPVAGTDNTTACKPTRPVAVLQIHAQNDTHVLFNGGAGKDAFRDVSKVTDFTSVPDTVARWAKRNGCSAPPQRVLERPGAVCEEHTGCQGRASVQLCVTETGGHSWPGAAKVRAGKEPASQAISANDVMWDFFQKH
jgi:polyhydroxybutyrate depolymerase